MEQNKASIIIANELIKADLLLVFNKEEALIHLERLYAIGYDEGRLRLQKSNRKPVAKLDDSGGIIETYPSTNSAAKDNKTSKGQISKAANGKLTKTAGFFWKYI